LLSDELRFGDRVIPVFSHEEIFAAAQTLGLEYVIDQLRADVVLEVDVFCAATAKVDVTALLRRVGDRVKALHVKDGFVGVNPFTVDAPPFDKAMLEQRSAGQGELPMLDYLAASPSTDYAVIEFDHFAGCAGLGADE